MPNNTTETIDRQVAAYNARSLPDCLACFSADAVIERELDGTRISGLPAIEKFYATLFESYPQNSCRIIHRLIVGEHVIDEEIIAGRPEGPFRTVVIYRVHNGQIVHLRALGRESVADPTSA